MGLAIRPVTEADRALAAQWCERARVMQFNPAVLPPLGVVCEDDFGPCAMAWVYQSCNIGVAFVEWAVERPGGKWSERRAAIKAVLDGLQSAVKPLGYGLLVAYALPGCAKILRSFGWEGSDPRPKIPMIKVL